MDGLQMMAEFKLARRQTGASLFIALIALVVLSLTGLALVRTVDTSNVVAGNLAFQRTGLNVNDLGIQAAHSFLASTGIAALDSNLPAGCTASQANSGCHYYAGWDANAADEGGDADTRNADSTEGIRTSVGDWSGVPCTYGGSSVPAGCPSATSVADSTIPSGYFYRRVVERLCTPGFAVVGATEDAIRQNCFSSAMDSSEVPSSKTSTGTEFPLTSEIFYRATVRVDGPRNSQSRTQVIIAKPRAA